MVGGGPRGTVLRSPGRQKGNLRKLLVGGRSQPPAPAGMKTVSFWEIKGINDLQESEQRVEVKTEAMPLNWEWGAYWGTELDPSG